MLRRPREQFFDRPDLRLRPARRQQRFAIGGRPMLMQQEPLHGLAERWNVARKIFEHAGRRRRHSARTAIEVVDFIVRRHAASISQRVTHALDRSCPDKSIILLLTGGARSGSNAPSVPRRMQKETRTMQDTIVVGVSAFSIAASR
jgi:hypothetical protein